MTLPPASRWGTATPGGAAAPRLLLRRLREAMAAPGDGQQRLDQIVRLIATSMVAEVCSVYLMRGREMLELCATEGLKPESVHRARLKVGEGLVGVIAREAEIINTAKAREHPEFRYLPETGEDAFSSFLGVPIQRLGKVMGVLVVQNARPVVYNDEDAEALRLVAMVIAEMADAGALLPPDDETQAEEKGPFHVAGTGAADGVAIGWVHLHEPRLLLPNPIAEDASLERQRLREAMESLRADIDAMLDSEQMPSKGEHRDVMETYRMFANDRGWLRRLEASVASGLTAEAAVDSARTEVRAKFDRASDPYLRERFNDMDDLAQRLLRRLIGQEASQDIREGAILIARAIGPGELMDYKRGTLAGVVLEDGSPSSHATIVARSLDIPLVVQAGRIAREADEGDLAIVNGDQGHVHIRPREDVVTAYEEKITLRAQEKKVYATLRDLPAETRDGVRIGLMMNAGLSADLPSLNECGAEGVGLLRTELQFMLSRTMPTREDQTSFCSHILDKAAGRPVVFRTLDVGSDKVLPYLKQHREDNPALGWRAIRLGLDRPAILKMQTQALLRSAKGRPLSIMFPMVADLREFERARAILLEELDRIDPQRHPPPSEIKIGAMLETPSLAFEDDRFFQLADFVSIGGNDLLQFFYAADRMNERTAGRYDLISPPFLRMLRVIVERCRTNSVDLSFCGEAAGKPLEALVLAATGITCLSMRPAAVGPVKRTLRSADLGAVREAIARAEHTGASIRQAVLDHCAECEVPV